MNLDAKTMLAAYDKFMSGKKVTADEKAIADHASKVAAFASQAYEWGFDPGHAAHAMTRAFLCAMIDPMHPDLDYLRIVPSSGADMRGRN